MTYVEDFVATPPMRDLKWRTKEGVYYYPWEMTDDHLENCLKHIEGIFGERAGQRQTWHQVFRCELKRRQVQNAHQPPLTRKVEETLSHKGMHELLTELDRILPVAMKVLDPRPIKPKARVKTTRKGRKTK